MHRGWKDNKRYILCYLDAVVSETVKDIYF
jgi:hypothetical protein